MKNKYDYSELLEFLNQNTNLRTGTKRLVVFLGPLGDFDSFEYARILLKSSKSLSESKIEFLIIGLGNILTKSRFSSFTGLPEEKIFVLEDNYLHKSLGLSSGLELTRNSFLNLILMCIGIGSPGTIKEVFRGYLGDRQAPQVFDDQELINISGIASFSSKFFTSVSGGGYQRPFELATLRLRNMIEILSRWNIYFPNKNFYTQRGGTFLLDRDDNLIFTYFPKSLLLFSSTPSNPLGFLNL